MDSPRFAVVDVETTGGKPERSRVIEIGIVHVDDWKISQKFESLVQPGEEISPFIENLTGITGKMLRNAPTFDGIASDVGAFLAGRIFVSHNVAFDYAAVGREMRLSGFDFSPERLCTLKLSRRVFPGLAKYSLHELSLSLCLPDFGHHRALNDAEAAARLLILAKERGGLSQIEELLRGGKRPLVYPAGWTDASFREIPRAPGIAYFVGNEDVLYAVAARNLQSCVLGFLSGSRRRLLKGLPIVDIRVKELGSELLAKLCLESELKRKKFPCNAAVQRIPDVGKPLPDMAVFLPGRFGGDRGVVVVRGGKVLGYTFVREDAENRLSDVLERLTPFEQTANLVPLLRRALHKNGIRVQFLT